MTILQCELVKPIKLFDDFEDTFIVDIRIRIRSQSLLEDQNMSLKYVPAEIQDVLSTIYQTFMTQFDLKTPHTNLQPLTTSTQQQTPEQLRHRPTNRSNNSILF